VEWDKDDLNDLGILKVESCAFGHADLPGQGLSSSGITTPELRSRPGPQAIPTVYDMICRADTIGVFQIESRAQIDHAAAPEAPTLYDLVIEVAMSARPIQGDMVHPYLRRRDKKERSSIPSPSSRGAGQDPRRAAVPGAGDAHRHGRRQILGRGCRRLRRAMATFRKNGTMHHFGDKMIEGMVANGYERDFAERCFHRSRASAITASPRAMRRASPSSPMSHPG